MGSDPPDPGVSVADAPKTSSMSLPQLAVAGGVSGLVARFATHPFDTLKTQMQVQGAVGFSPGRGGFATTSGKQMVGVGPPHVPYKNVLDGARKVLARDGHAGFYRGFGAVVVGIPFASGAYFAGYETSKAITSAMQKRVAQDANGGFEGHGNDADADARDGHKSKSNSAVKNLLTSPTFGYLFSGVIAQSLAGIVYTPIDVVKERAQAGAILQNSGLAAAGGRYRNFHSAYWQIVKKEGLTKGLFRGYWASNFTWWPFSVVYFVTYEHLRDRVARYYAQPLGFGEKRRLESGTGIGDETASDQTATKETLPPWVSGACGFFAAAVATAATHPLDLAKTRLQTLRVGSVAVVTGVAGDVVSGVVSGGTAVANTVRGSNPGKGIASHWSLPSNASVFSIARGVWKREGARALFSGVGARVAAVAPGSAISFFVYESIKEVFSEGTEGKAGSGTV